MCFDEARGIILTWDKLFIKQERTSTECLLVLTSSLDVVPACAWWSCSVWLNRYFLVQISGQNSVILKCTSLSKSTLTSHEKLTRSPIRKPLMKPDVGFNSVLLQRGETDSSWSSEDWIQRNSLRRGIATLPSMFYCFKLQFGFLPARLWRIVYKLVHVAAAHTIHFSIHSPSQFASNSVPYTRGLCADSYQFTFTFLSLEMLTIFFSRT